MIQVRDLLDASGGALAQLPPKRGSRTSRAWEVVGQSWATVGSTADMSAAVARAVQRAQTLSRQRARGSAESAAGHVVWSLRLTGPRGGECEVRVVELQAMELLSVTMQERQLARLEVGLRTLHKALLALHRQSKQAGAVDAPAPFRDAVLTRLLQSTLSAAHAVTVGARHARGAVVVVELLVRSVACVEASSSGAAAAMNILAYAGAFADLLVRATHCTVGCGLTSHLPAGVARAAGRANASASLGSRRDTDAIARLEV